MKKRYEPILNEVVIKRDAISQKEVGGYRLFERKQTIHLARPSETDRPDSFKNVGAAMMWDELNRDIAHNPRRYGARKSARTHAPKTGGFIRGESMRSAYWTSRYYGARRMVA